MAKPPLNVGWQHPQGIESRPFRCGYCDQRVASVQGWYTNQGNKYVVAVCPNCRRPSFFEDAEQHPGIAFGAPVSSLPLEIEALYEEARRSCSIGAYTGAALLLRKLLMNIAVDLKAKPGLNFIEYIDYLAGAGYVPPNGKGWVDHIRKKGNEANHEITLMNKTDAEELIVFSEMLLKFIYEFPKRVPQVP